MKAQRTDRTAAQYIDKCAVHAVLNGRTEDQFVALWTSALQQLARDAYKLRNTPQRRAKAERGLGKKGR